MIKKKKKSVGFFLSLFVFFAGKNSLPFSLCQIPQYLVSLTTSAESHALAHAGQVWHSWAQETLARSSPPAALRRQHVCRGSARSCSGCHSSKFETDYVTWSVIEEHNQLKTFISGDKLINHSSFRWPLGLSRFHLLTYISCDLTPHRNFNDGHIM